MFIEHYIEREKIIEQKRKVDNNFNQQKWNMAKELQDEIEKISPADSHFIQKRDKVAKKKARKLLKNSYQDYLKKELKLAKELIEKAKFIRNQRSLDNIPFMPYTGGIDPRLRPRW